MKQKMTVFLLVAGLCLCLLAGCSKQSDDTGFYLYYQTRGEHVTQAVEGVFYQRGEPSISDLTEIFHQLTLPPEDQTLTSSIPAGTEIQESSLSDGILTLDLSAEYSTLSGVEQTIANSCIALTYCQLKEITAVKITCDGESMSSTPLTKDLFMLDGGEGDTGQMDAQLYFPTEDGTAIGYLTLRLTVTEDKSPAETVLQGLCNGPDTRQLQSFLPARASGVTLWTEDGVCCVNLTADWVDQLESGGEETLILSLRCITNSLCQLDSVSSVQFLMDGAVLTRWADVGGDGPLLPDTADCILISDE